MSRILQNATVYPSVVAYLLLALSEKFRILSTVYVSVLILMRPKHAPAHKLGMKILVHVYVLKVKETAIGLRSGVQAPVTVFVINNNSNANHQNNGVLLLVLANALTLTLNALQVKYLIKIPAVVNAIMQ